MHTHTTHIPDIQISITTLKGMNFFETVIELSQWLSPFKNVKHPYNGDTFVKTETNERERQQHRLIY